MTRIRRINYPLFKYVTIENLHHILDGKIRFTQPGAFNDPFEMLPEIRIPSSKNSPCQNINISFDLLAPRRCISITNRTAEGVNEECNDILSRDIRKALDSSIGILCLSKNKNSLTMWAHYASQYSGAIIEFDESNVFFQGAIPVDYQPNRDVKSVSYYLEENKPIPVSELCVKSKEWEYESEIRVVRSLADCEKLGDDINGYPIFVMSLPQNVIKSIYFGERTSLEDKKLVYQKIKDTNIQLYLNAVAFNGYEFRSEIIKFNKPRSELAPIISPRTADIFTEQMGDFGIVAQWMKNNHKMSKVVNKTV